MLVEDLRLSKCKLISIYKGRAEEIRKRETKKLEHNLCLWDGAVKEEDFSAHSLPAKPQGKPKNPGVVSLSLLQQIFPTQESNQGLPHCKWILY